MTSAMVDENAFEEPILEIEKRLEEIAGFGGERGSAREVEKLRRRLDKVREDVYSHLTPWQATLVARHAKRPYTADYLAHLCTDFIEIHGDRKFADDPAILGGFALYHGEAVAVIGHQKGRDTKEKIRRNFGMARPEGYRKALRIMKMAEKFHRPVLTFIDTPGAYPGIGAEERGQAEAIATNLREMARLRVPILVTITGEGGSGGALGLGVGDRIHMLAHSIYSVISPEGCAAILWKSDKMKQEAARAMGITADRLLTMGIIDEIVAEPPGGAHADPARTFELVDEALRRSLRASQELSVEDLLTRRHAKFRSMGAFRTV
ncbi:MAG: acetyl-CoA carboxylase carboxyltransferase subunit alpha [Acidobacteriota bacterium]